MALLEVKNLYKSFGGLSALVDFNMMIEEGELVGLIGPNGAGKTTVFNLVTGVYRPDRGSIMMEGRSLVGRKPHDICRTGIARTFQNIRLFGGLSVIDNVRISFHKDVPYSLPAAVLRLPVFIRGEGWMDKKASKYLELLGLLEKKDELAKNLPYGDQRRLEIARALATNPKLVILDEPAAGMNPQETQELMKLILSLRDEFKLTILLIEHDMSLVMGLCERILVLDYGRTIAEGRPEEIKNNPRVIEAYLGEEVV
ncbi:ABC transporter ATP-binding protein [Syntrophothermus lipocalidus]|uniref:ABC transporter related protein n=1 Tax=Syntrophothermus lipocalidus (strain DSM 12680 / TGB-C1) TaxID=643648 RepID=D7CKB1_SYNLT|nr:ABC transporter ATP-binding protein [Syntrophothermus lipocalidus]ADI03095.1 ABC transporter related protein [Syntrophothermus lipocalidus DSM 12680]